MSHLTLGAQGEAAVADYVQRKGYTILACNYKRPCGEIDIIARSRSMLIFIEVKTRTKNYFDAAELITPAKQKRILMTASSYLLAHNYATMACRFDVALISWQNTLPSITYLQDAFSGDID
jgi:putative endonuclease